jgi:hypothetical protein
MADEVMDGTDPAASGYVDDDLDLDDDDDVMETTPTAADAAATAAGSAAGPAVAALPSGPALPPPDPCDYALRSAGEGDRAMIVARFLSTCPDLSPPTRMRMLLDGEEGPEARAEAQAKDRKQWAYYRSHIGRERRAIKEKQGFIDIPDRDRKKWRLDVVNEDDVRGSDAQGGGGSEGPGGADGEEDKTCYFERYPKCTRGFEGSFEGKSSSRYGVLMVDERTRTASLVPIRPYAWFSFRQRRGRRVTAKVEQTTEGVEKKIRKKAEAGARKLAKYQAMGELAQEKAEYGQGSLADVKAKKENAMVGIHRGRARANEDRKEAREGLDFDEEFADDDLAQVEKEEEEETAPAVSRGQDYLKKFRQMIKDEDTAAGAQGAPSSRPGSPGSDDDEADATVKLEKVGGSRPTSPGGSRPTSPSRRSRPNSPAGRSLPPKGPGARASKAGAAGGAAGGSAAGSRPGSDRLTPRMPSPGSGSTPGTPLRDAYAHLLPPLGVLPEERHVVDVLRAMVAANAPGPVPLKQFTRVFEHGTKAQKKNLMATLKPILRRVADVIETPPGSKVYAVSLKPGI